MGSGAAGPVALAASVVALAASLFGCLSNADLGEGQKACPSATDFREVSNVLERRCGTMDCHGDPARPFIVFGQNALRRPGGESSAADPGGYFAGGPEPTTDFELEGTLQSACGLDPEEMDAVVQGTESPDNLTLVRKPRLVESHKGGRLWPTGSTEGDRCLVSWILGAVDIAACRSELTRQ
jgi:hypothetical protein